MQRWKLTVALSALAVGGAWLAPTLKAALAPPPVAAPPVEVVVPPLMDPVVTEGHLKITAGLDRQAMLVSDVTERFLTIEVSAPKDLGSSYRRPVDLALAMDRSGSMAARGKIDYAKAAAKHVIGQLSDDDVYSLVVFSSRAETVVGATHVTSADSLRRRIDRVYEQGDTNIVAGLDLAAAEIAKPIGESGVGRIVLLSDGKPTTGVVDPDAIVRRVGELAASGVSVSAIGLGLDYNEDLLARIADVGGGSYDFVDNPKDLGAVFQDELDASTRVVATGTRVSVDLGPEVEVLDVFGWESSPTESGISVYMGDVAAGQTRKITARIRLKTPDAAQALDVASVSAEYFDLVDERDAASSASCEATVTRDAQAVSRSLDRDLAVHANRAWGNAWLERSARAYAAGEKEEAKSLAARSEEVLRYAFDDYQAPELAADAEQSAQLRDVIETAKPSTDEGKRSIKAAKQHYRSTSM